VLSLTSSAVVGVRRIGVPQKRSYISCHGLARALAQFRLRVYVQHTSSPSTSWLQDLMEWKKVTGACCCQPATCMSISSWLPTRLAL